MKPMAKKQSDSITRNTGLLWRTGELDYFALLYIEQNKERKKVWVCISTCMTVRAIHLEIVEDMTSEQLMLALRRFVSYRGKSSEIISDNSPHFKVAKDTIDITYGKTLSATLQYMHIAETKG